MAQPTQAPRPSNIEARPREGGGWLTFAAVLFLLAGTFNAIYGIAALANDDYFAIDELLFGDLTLWGWIYLGFAATQIAAGLLILNRSVGGAIMGISLAALHAIGVLLSIGAYPVWSVILLVIDGMIIYGLTVYGLVED